MQRNLKEWQKFIAYYSDLNNARKEKDESYKKEQYVGEELDWKMLADNLSLFSSQVEDLKDLRGFEDNDSSMLMDQSIIQHSGSGIGMGGVTENLLGNIYQQSRKNQGRIYNNSHHF